MAPHPVNGSNRLWVKKVGVTGTSEIMFRGRPNSNEVDLLDIAENFLNATKGLVFDDDAWVSARYSAQGSNLSFPSDWTPIVGTNGTTFDPAFGPFFVDWIGRGTDGTRVRWSIQGAVRFTDSNFRVTAMENVAVANGIEALRAAEDLLGTITRVPVRVYDYADVGYNAYRQRKARR